MNTANVLVRSISKKRADLSEKKPILMEAGIMRRARPLHKYLRLAMALSFCLVAAERRAFVAHSQDRASQPPALIALDMVRDSMKTDEPYRAGQEIRAKVIAKNESAEPITIRVINEYAQSRPQLLRNGKVVPYRSQIAKLITIRDAEPDIVRVGRVDFIVIQPYSAAVIKMLNLGDWYSHLDPGSYRLTNRYRFEIGGQWSAESKPVVFEVAPEK
ncbi:MAG: hypothetical protein ACXW3C_03550 [Pyrinomonadaceae bacterium]